jgi:hypothetical protein
MQWGIGMEIHGREKLRSWVKMLLSGWSATPDPSCQRIRRKSLMKSGLSFFHGDCVCLTDFDAAFATEAFLCINGDRFAILHFENFDGANVYAFLTTFTFFFVDCGYKRHNRILLS